MGGGDDRTLTTYMTKPTIRPGTEADAISLAYRLRREDALEIILTSPDPLEETLLESLKHSTECFAAEVDGLVIAMGGFRLLPNRIGIPWMVGSPEIEEYPVSMVAAGRAAVDRWASQCDVMANVTHKDNVVHHRWLRHIGFTFLEEEVLVGAQRAPFLQFYRHS